MGSGPICSYNAFVAQFLSNDFKRPVASVLRSLAWIALVGVGFDILLHYSYYYSANQYLYWERRGFAGWETHWAGYWTLTFMYLKFLTIWRFFRCWAQLDGVESPENMLKCVHNNCSFQGFWKGWHASFNKWNVRYRKNEKEYSPLVCNDVEESFIFFFLFKKINT